MVPWYHGTRVPWYTCTNITLSQKRLEIQALRCNGNTSGRCQHRRHHGILQLRFQLDSDVCSADLHHNPRKHVPWYVPKIGTRVPMVPIWYSSTNPAVRTRVLEYVHVYSEYHGTRCRHRCRVGTSTVVYRDAFYADNAHLCPCCT